MILSDERRRRVDAGTVRQTPRDAGALEWLAQMYGAPLDLIARGLGVSDSRAWSIADRWRRAGWAEIGKITVGPLWVWPTQSTARTYLGWDVPAWAPRQTTAAHTRAVCEARIWAQGGLQPEDWSSDRMLRHEAAKGQLRQRGQEMPHVPDGLLTKADGSRWLVEVELTPKTPQRTYRILSELMGGDFGTTDLHAEGVIYVVAAAARQVVEDAKRRLEESHRKDLGIRIHTLEEIRR